mmetsp:Transcript_3925/g.9543  ORF Transcript_3925/g.9543 Transcript_3925/m.9543 type:complete len:376 (+) Transcript_3925:644-1771(+)
MMALEIHGRVFRRAPDHHRASNNANKKTILTSVAMAINKFWRSPMGSGGNLQRWEQGRKDMHTAALKDPASIPNYDGIARECTTIDKDAAAGLEKRITVQAMKSSRFYRTWATAQLLLHYGERMVGVLGAIISGTYETQLLTSVEETAADLAQNLGDDAEGDRMRMGIARAGAGLLQEEVAEDGDESDSDAEWDEDEAAEADKKGDYKLRATRLQALVKRALQTDAASSHVSVVSAQRHYHLFLLKLSQFKQGDDLSQFTVPGYTAPQQSKSQIGMMYDFRKQEGAMFQKMGVGALQAATSRESNQHALAFIRQFSRQMMFQLYHPAGHFWFSYCGRQIVKPNAAVVEKCASSRVRKAARRQQAREGLRAAFSPW